MALSGPLIAYTRRTHWQQSLWWEHNVNVCVCVCVGHPLYHIYTLSNRLLFVVIRPFDIWLINWWSLLCLIYSNWTKVKGVAHHHSQSLSFERRVLLLFGYLVDMPSGCVSRASAPVVQWNFVVLLALRILHFYNTRQNVSKPVSQHSTCLWFVCLGVDTRVDVH